MISTLEEESHFMTHIRTWGWVFLCLLLICLPVFAQESAVKGNIAGVIQDSTGAVVAGAKVTLTGPLGKNVATTDPDGRFLFSTPHARPVRRESREARLQSSGSKGNRSRSWQDFIDYAEARARCCKRSHRGHGQRHHRRHDFDSRRRDLSDTFYQQVPVARNVASLFYVAPGATDSGGAGHSNPSISGASGLENLYMADGVNITDSAFGGLGTFTRRQGSIGSGINLSFIKEVNVKTGGFEPQYGEATGGIVQLVTKSGSNQWHGEIGGFAAPHGAEGTFVQTDPARTNKNGFYNGNANFDADGQLGGYVPGFKNHLFFFGDFNPSWQQQYVQAPPTAGLAALGQLTLFARTYNYAGKLTWKAQRQSSIRRLGFRRPHQNQHERAELGAQYTQ